MWYIYSIHIPHTCIEIHVVCLPLQCNILSLMIITTWCNANILYTTCMQQSPISVLLVAVLIGHIQILQPIFAFCHYNCVLCTQTVSLYYSFNNAFCLK